MADRKTHLGQLVSSAISILKRLACCLWLAHIKQNCRHALERLGSAILCKQRMDFKCSICIDVDASTLDMGKVEITHEFDREEVLIGIRIVEKTTTNKLRCGVRVTVADLYRSLREKELDKRDLKRAVDAEISGETLDGKRLKADLYENPQLGGPDYFEKGARTFTFESEKIDGKELSLSTVDKDAGWIEVKQTKLAYNGFNLHWRPDPAKSGTPGARLRLAVD